MLVAEGQPQIAAAGLRQSNSHPLSRRRRLSLSSASRRWFVAQQRGQRLPQGERHQRAAGNDAGIAVGGFLARIAPVDQGDLGTQALQFQDGDG
ncbi:hypothetical protein [Comamonas terrigena]|uniref:hypothetical protein n=1 Tax=Comamonas terrigena TaxID=32013 RepID=UPI0035E411E5